MKPSVIDLDDPRWVALHGPGELAWHQLALEAVVVACFVATAVHALRAWRQGAREPGFRWLTVLVYGLTMELVSFHFIQNYAHATFSMQLYHGQLPLYISFIYLVFHHTGIEIARRFDLGPWREAAVAGLCIVLLDVPFDLVGPSAGWWIWADNTHTAPHPRLVEAVAARWYGVPVTSLYWYFLYGGLLSVFTRAVHRRWGDHPVRLLVVAPFVAWAVVVCGSLAMEPLFWLPRALGAPDGGIVGAVLAAAAVWAVRLRRPDALPAWLAAIPAALYVLHAVVLLQLAAVQPVDHLPARVAWLAVAGALIAWIAARPGASAQGAPGAEAVAG